MGTKRPPALIELRADGKPKKARKKGRRYRTDAQQFVAGMFRMHAASANMGGGTVRPFGLRLNFSPEQVFNRTSPTSMRRLWSQLTRKPMRWLDDKPPHPRPWEGPQSSTAGWPAKGFSVRGPGWPR